jgi:hypothetical protein
LGEVIKDGRRLKLTCEDDARCWYVYDRAPVADRMDGDWLLTEYHVTQRSERRKLFGDSIRITPPTIVVGTGSWGVASSVEQFVQPEGSAACSFRYRSRNKNLEFVGHLYGEAARNLKFVVKGDSDAYFLFSRPTTSTSSS